MFTISLIDNYPKILNYFLGQCSHFMVSYPGDECSFDSNNPLMFKKDCFVGLAETKISQWDNMPNSISVSGRLTSNAKQIFVDSLAQKGLWHYILYRDGIAILSVSDFDVGAIDISQSEMEYLLSEHILSSNDFF